KPKTRMNNRGSTKRRRRATGSRSTRRSSFFTRVQILAINLSLSRADTGELADAGEILQEFRGRLKAFFRPFRQELHDSALEQGRDGHLVLLRLFRLGRADVADQFRQRASREGGRPLIRAYTVAPRP